MVRNVHANNLFRGSLRNEDGDSKEDVTNSHVEKQHAWKNKKTMISAGSASPALAFNTFLCRPPWSNRELKQPRLRRRQNRRKFALFNNEKQKLSTLCESTFYFRTFPRPSRPFQDVKWPILLLCGRREHLTSKLKFFFSYLKPLIKIDHLRVHFSFFFKASVRAKSFLWISVFM